MALTTAGINNIARALIGDGSVVPFNSTNARLGVGNSNAAFTASQTDLQGANTFRKALDEGYPIAEPSSAKLTFKATFGPTEANFAWNEWGVFNADAGGVMLNRVVDSNGTKQDGQTWIMEVDITFTIGN